MNHIYCPCCGHPMTIDGEVTMPRSGITFLQLTCDQRDCKAFSCTTTGISVRSGDFVRQWSFKVKFDTQTGKRVGSEGNL